MEFRDITRPIHPLGICDDCGDSFEFVDPDGKEFRCRKCQTSFRIKDSSNQRPWWEQWFSFQSPETIKKLRFPFQTNRKWLFKHRDSNNDRDSETVIADDHNVAIYKMREKFGDQWFENWHWPVRI